jgi:hypothetical protein
MLNVCGEKLIELYSANENSTILVRKEGSIFDNFQPGEFIQPVVGSLDEKGSTINWLVATADGFLANYQMKRARANPIKGDVNAFESSIRSN